MTKYFIKAGYVRSNAKAAGGGALAGPNHPLSDGMFDLHRWLRNELVALSVSNVDTCCTPDATSQPVRFNTTAGHLQYLLNGVWTTVPNL